MGLTKLRSPRPRRHFLDDPDVSWPTHGAQRLVPPAESAGVDTLAVLDERRSRRHFATLQNRQLSAFLWYTARTRVSWRDEAGRSFESRPAPSAGGCHPHDLVIVRPQKQHLIASVYDPHEHALRDIICRQALLRRFATHVAQVLPIERGTIVWIAGQPQRTANRYRYPESLLWRDAGTLLGVMAVVAEALHLAFCPLGITGDPYVSKVAATSDIWGFGGAIVGGQRRQDR